MIMNLVMIVERIMRYSSFFFKVIATNERKLMDQGDMYKSKLVRYPLHSHAQFDPNTKSFTKNFKVVNFA